MGSYCSCHQPVDEVDEEDYEGNERESRTITGFKLPEERKAGEENEMKEINIVIDARLSLTDKTEVKTQIKESDRANNSELLGLMNVESNQMARISISEELNRSSIKSPRAIDPIKTELKNPPKKRNSRKALAPESPNLDSTRNVPLKSLARSYISRKKYIRKLQKYRRKRLALINQPEHPIVIEFEPLIPPSVLRAVEACKDTAPMLLPNNAIYRGGLRNGIRHGFGIEILYNVYRYTGNYKEGDKCGEGALILTRGLMHVGIYEGDTANGEGVLYYTDGSSVEGYFINGCLEGKAVKKYTNGSTYECEYKEGEDIGNGFIKNLDGSTYEGEVKNDKYDGKGTIYYSDKSSYVGDFKAGFISGNGTYYWPNGDMYIGGFWKGKKWGFGVLKTKKGEVFEGMWANDKKNGEGLKKRTRKKETENKYEFWIKGNKIK